MKEPSINNDVELKAANPMAVTHNMGSPFLYFLKKPLLPARLNPPWLSLGTPREAKHLEQIPINRYTNSINPHEEDEG